MSSPEPIDASAEPEGMEQLKFLLDKHMHLQLSEALQKNNQLDARPKRDSGTEIVKAHTRKYHEHSMKVCNSNHAIHELMPRCVCPRMY